MCCGGVGGGVEGADKERGRERDGGREIERETNRPRDNIKVSKQTYGIKTTTMVRILKGIKKIHLC